MKYLFRDRGEDEGAEKWEDSEGGKGARDSINRARNSIFSVCVRRPKVVSREYD